MLVGYGNYNTYLSPAQCVGTTVTAGTISGALGQAYTAVSVGSKPSARFPGRIIWRPRQQRQQRVDKSHQQRQATRHIMPADSPTLDWQRCCQCAEILCFGGAAAEINCFIGDMAYAKRANSDVGSRRVNAN